jgi:hypothetical protein
MALENAPSVVTWWALSGEAVRDTIEVVRDRMAAIGHTIPALEEPTPRTLLRRALRVFGSGVLIRPSRDGKYAIVKEKWTEETPEYSTIAVVSVDTDEDGDVELGWEGGETEEISYDILELAYTNALQNVSVEEMSSWVLSVAAHFQSVRVRESGGVYFILDGSAWDEFRNAMHANTRHVIHSLRVATNESAIDTVVAALKEEVSALTDEAMVAVDGKGLRAIERRRELLERAEQRVRMFERAFDIVLESVTEEIQKVDAKCVAAIMRMETL